MSNYGNRNSKMPDTSPQLRSGFTTRQVSICVSLVILFIALCVLVFYALDAQRARDLKTAITAANAREAEFKESANKAVQQLREIETREANVARAEEALTSREETLNAERIDFETERLNFKTRTTRIRNLCSLLLQELDAEFPIKETVEEIMLDDEE